MLKRSTSWVHMAAEPSYFDKIVKIIIGKRYMNLMMAHDRGSEFGFCLTQFNLLVDIIFLLDLCHSLLLGWNLNSNIVVLLLVLSFHF